MYENAFNSVERQLRAEDGIANELDYVEQISWVLFLKYLHDLESERNDRAALNGAAYEPLIGPAFRWSDWAAPKTANGGFDHNKALIGDDLIGFVDRDLFPNLASFRQSATNPRTIEYKIGEIFTELRNKFRSGYILRDVLEIIDGLSFNTQAERHELSELYESRIRRMGNAGRNGGEYYTPRPLIRAMIKVVDPKIGETIYDGAVGSAGFLCESWEYMRRPDLTASDYEALQCDTFFGQEKKSLAYIIGIMNMVLHGIEAPNIVHTNSLTENVMDFQERDRHDIVLANPPFGGGERREVQHNFPIRSGETAYLFLQHFIRKLRAGGRAAVVIKNTFLSNADNASVALRRDLLESCNLHTILDCPSGTFQGAGVKTVVLFFEKGAPTRDIWYYQLDPGRSLGKTNPLNDRDLTDFVELWERFAEGPKSWRVVRSDLDQETLDLSVNNPNTPKKTPLRSPEEIIADMLACDAETAEILENIQRLDTNFRHVLFDPNRINMVARSVGDVATLQRGFDLPRKHRRSGPYPIVSSSGKIDDHVEAKVAGPGVTTGRSGSIGNVFYIEEDFWPLNTSLYVKDFHENNVRFIFHLLRELRLERFASGTGVPTLNRNDVHSEIVHLPLQVSVQEEIAEALDTLAELLDELEALCKLRIEMIGDLRQSTLSRAFSSESS